MGTPESRPRCLLSGWVLAEGEGVDAIGSY